MSDALSRIISNIPLPEGSVVTEAVVVIGYIDSDGDPCYMTKTAGDCPASTIIGLLEMGKHRVMHETNPTPCEQRREE